MAMCEYVCVLPCHSTTKKRKIHAELGVAKLAAQVFFGSLLG